MRDRALLRDDLTKDRYAGDLWALPFPGPADGTWTQLTTAGGDPSARGSLDAVIYGDDMYLFCGITDEGPFADLWRLDVKTVSES